MRRRNGTDVNRALKRLGAAASSETENLLPILIECCRAYATVGEMVGVLKQAWGEFKEPIRLAM